MSPYSFKYLLFKSVILIFIATFCECTALLGSLGRKLSGSMVVVVFFLDKSLQTKTIRNICHSCYHHSFYQVSTLPVLLSLPADGDLIAT